MSRKGAPTFNSLLSGCVLWFTGQDSAGVSGGIDEFPILPSGVTVTNNGTFTKTDLGNNKSVLTFDGSTNYISLTDNDIWNIYDGDFTVCAWIKQENVTTKHFILVYQYVDANNQCGVYWNYSQGKCIHCIIKCPTVKEYRTRRSSSFPFLLSSKNMWPFYFTTTIRIPRQSGKSTR